MCTDDKVLGTAKLSLLPVCAKTSNLKPLPPSPSVNLPPALKEIKALRFLVIMELVLPGWPT